MKLGAKDINVYLAKAPALGFPKQMQRALPACIALILIVSFLYTTSLGEVSTAVFAPRNRVFPRKVWQTWKVDPLDFEQRDLDTARTWPAKNPTYRYEVLTDQNDLAWVETHFGPDGFNRLDIVYIYRELTARIIKADLLRYLVMYVEGGVYTDIDVEAIRPVSKFIPDRFDERDVDMVVGVEIDQPDFREHPILGQKCESFCQWTFMCKPKLPVMMHLVENIMRWLKGISEEQGVPISEIKLNFDQVIAGTGPSAFTRAILDDMSVREGKKITWDQFHDLSESKLLGRVLVLNVEAFAAGQGHSDSGNHDTKHALVRHHYHASKWPDKHPRFSHPIFGMVEECNWKPDCVRKWDEDTANYAKLTPEEQANQLAIFESAKEQEQIEKENLEKLEKLDHMMPPPPPPEHQDFAVPPPPEVPPPF